MSREVSLVDLIVHELRTPLTVALGSLKQVDGAGPAADAALGRARRSCERLEQIAADMRDFVRVSQLDGSPAAPVDLPAAIAQAAAFVQSLRDVRIETRCDPVLQVLALPDRFEKALGALLLALARATGPDDDAIVVAAAMSGTRVEVVGSRGAPAPADGDGFDAEWTGGVGFALPLARLVIERAGGEVRSTTSADGRFGAFRVSLPPASPAPPR